MSNATQLPPIVEADLARVSGAGLPSLWALPFIMVGYAFSGRSDKNRPGLDRPRTY